MSDAFSQSAYSRLLGGLMAKVHQYLGWMETLRKQHRHAEALDACRELQQFAGPFVETVTDFIQRHVQFEKERLNALQDLTRPNPFDDSLVAFVCNGIARTHDKDGRGIDVSNPIVQAIHEARAAYDLEVERVRKALADGPWSKPDSPKRWAGQFGISDRTFKRRVEDGTIRAKVLSDRLYQIHLGDLPPERPASTSGHK